MTSMALTVSDSATMVRRSLKHMLRYPSMTVMLVGMPIIFLLLFVFVFGATLGAGLGGVPGTPSGGRSAYLAYVVPGILLMSIAATAQGTAISVAMDMTEGVIARFRTMAIARVSVLTGHVIGSQIQAMLAVVVVLAVAVLLGFRPTGDPLGWLGALGVLALISFAVVWLSVALGMATKSVTASNLPMPLVLLPFLGSGFVPTDSMPDGLRWFAEYQPFTPVIETVRGLLMGTPVAPASLWLALGWSVVITLGSYLWARKLYERLPNRT
jgi:ABC-type polysaccharide/polyol phosphate export systems, permease component